jgi:hypothetical protein
MAVQRECDPALWNEGAGRTSSTKEVGRLLNTFLDGLVSRAYAHQNELIQNQLPVTVEAIKNRLAGKADKLRMLVSIFEQHNKEISQLFEKEYSPSTPNRYETSLKHVVEFMQWKFGILISILNNSIMNP